MSSASDIQVGDWIDRLAPASIRPYLRLARLDRPIGAWLLLFPCWWSTALAAQPGSWPDWSLMVLFALGAVVMRGAGCTINDIVDRDIDAKVTRTAGRPLPSGQITVQRAFAFLGLQLIIGFLVLFQMSALAIWLGIGSLALIATYPYMKRVTWWPQAFLGLTFNWGALLGWAAVRGDLGWPAIWLYVAGVFWTLFYDTIYAHQDKADDALIGVKSTALKLGKDTKSWLAGFGVLMILLLVVMAIAADLAWPAKLGVIGVAAHLIWQLMTVDLDDAQDCLAKFKSNRFIGWILLVGVIAGRLAQ